MFLKKKVKGRLLKALNIIILSVFLVQPAGGPGLYYVFASSDDNTDSVVVQGDSNESVETSEESDDTKDDSETEQGDGETKDSEDSTPSASKTKKDDVDEVKCVDKWEEKNGVYTRCVEEGIEYELDINKKDNFGALKITFTNINEEKNKDNDREVTIKEVLLTDKQVIDLNALSNIAYDVTSTMENGSFEYDLVLPIPRDANLEDKAINVVYVEDEEALEDLTDDNVVKDVTEDKHVKVKVDTKAETVETKNLDHMTIWIVTGSVELIVSSSVNGSDQVIIAPGETIDVGLEVGIWSGFIRDWWRSTEYRIDGGVWECANTLDHRGIWFSTRHFTENFNITAPSIDGTYDLELRVHRNDDCSDLVAPLKPIEKLHDAIIVDGTVPEMNNLEIFVQDDTGTYVPSDFVTVGDMVRVDVEATDVGSGIKDVEFRIKKVAGGGYVTSREWIDTPISGNIYRFEFQIPTDGRYIDTHALMTEDLDGHTAWARATDKAGNYNHGISDTFTYDNTVPEQATGIHILDYTGAELGCGGVTNNRTITVDWDDSNDDNFAYFNYETRGTWKTTVVPSQRTGQISDEDGEYKYRVQAVDKAGNKGEFSDWCYITLDRTAPEVPRQTGYNEDNGDDFATPRDPDANELSCTGDATNINGVSVHWTDVSASGTNIKYQRQYSAGTGDWTGNEIYTDPYTNYRTFGGSSGSEGIYGSQVRAWEDHNNNGEIDSNENVSDWSNECSVTFDVTEPAMPTGLKRLAREDHSEVFECGDTTYIRGMHPDWEDNDTNADPSFSHYEYSSFNAPNGNIGISQRRFDDSIFEYNGSWLPNEGTYGFVVRAVDIAGNKSAWANGGTETFLDSCQITYDSTPPEGTIDAIKYPNGTVEPGKFVTHYNDPVILGTASDNIKVASVMLNVNGYNYAATVATSGDWEVNIDDVIPDGLHDMTVTITDAAENITDIVQTIRVDVVAPNATYKQFDGSTEVTGTIPIVNDLSRLSFTADYVDPGPTAGLYEDSYVIFEAQGDGSFRFSQNGKKAFCSWRSDTNLVDISGTTGDSEDTWSLTTPVTFNNCSSTVPDGEYYMAHQVYDFATRKDIPFINHFRDVLGLHFIVDTVAPVVEITDPSGDGEFLAGDTTFVGDIIEDHLSHYNLSLNPNPNADGTCDEIAKEATWDFSKRIWQADGNANGVSHDLDTTTLEDGHYVLRLAARDLAGNRDPMSNTGNSDSINYNRDPMSNTGNGDSVDYKCVTIDNANPTVNQLENQDFFEGQDVPVIDVIGKDNLAVKEFCATLSGPTSNFLPMGSINGCDNLGSGTEYTWNNATGFPTIFDTSVISEGTYTLDYYVVDSAGNKSDNHSVIYTVNNVAPQVTFSVSDDDIKENKDDVVFTASFVDPSTRDAGDNIFDDDEWSAIIDYGDHHNPVDLGVLTDDGAIPIPDHEYNKDGNLITTLTVCESKTNPASEGECTSASIDMNVDDVETKDSSSGGGSKTPATVTTPATFVSYAAADNVDITGDSEDEADEQEQDEEKTKQNAGQSDNTGTIVSTETDGGQVAGASTCRSWPFWAWLVVMLAYAGITYIIGRRAQNVSESKRNLLWQGLVLIGALGLWYFFDTCRTYTWVPIIASVVGVVLVLVLFNRTSGNTPPTQAPPNTKSDGPRVT